MITLHAVRAELSAYNMPQGRCWHSYHLGFSGALYDADGDRVVANVVLPIFEAARRSAWLQDGFYLRYSDVGPHIRLRLLGITPCLPDAVQAAMVAAVSSCGAISITPSRYEPEYVRYGGVPVMHHSERLFSHSSELASSFIAQDVLAMRFGRISCAATTACILLHCFDPARKSVCRLLAEYARLWAIAEPKVIDAGRVTALMRSIRFVWSSLDQRRLLPEPFSKWREDVDAYRSAFLAVPTTDSPGRLLALPATCGNGAWPVFSHMHMMNNRLGLSIREEAWLAGVLAVALGSEVLP